MLKRVLVGAVAVVILLAIVVATRPSGYGVERSVLVSAPASVPYQEVADFHRWDAWSPWAKLDPGMKTEYGGAASGEGATYHWSGNSKVGEGRMTITGARPDSEVTLRLEFLKPMEETTVTTFRFAPEGNGTKVTWQMEGRLGFIGKAMSLLKSMDALIGPDFERGLAKLKEVAESKAASSSQSAVSGSSP